jgi:hypothetical protein
MQDSFVEGTNPTDFMSSIIRNRNSVIEVSLDSSKPLDGAGSSKDILNSNARGARRPYGEAVQSNVCFQRRYSRDASFRPSCIESARPSESTKTWRLRPMTFLAASKPRGPPASVVLTL